RRTTTPQPPVLLSFFFQAEDGIRDGHVTGVQTCALPISAPHARPYLPPRGHVPRGAVGRVERGALRVGAVRRHQVLVARPERQRSEERRVGKEWRSRLWAEGGVREDGGARWRGGGGSGAA